MAFGRHGNRTVGNAVGQLCQGVAGTGCNDQNIQKLFGTDGLDLGNGMQGLTAAEFGSSADVLVSSSKTTVDGVGTVGENRYQMMGVGQIFHDREYG